MPDIEGSVGHPGGANNKHDVALIQVMLRAIKNKGQPYVAFNYDGICGLNRGTHKAIAAFQADQNIPVGPGKELIGLVKKGGATFAKMVALLPATHKELTSLKGEAFVYFAGSAAAASSQASAVQADAQYQSDFRTNLAALIRSMYSTYKMVLAVEPKHGGRRSFDEQASGLNTDAGPGESNHNYGNAADLGFDALRWVSRRSGQIITDNYHLAALEKENNALFVKLWELRNKLAPKLHKTNKKWDYIHIQSYKDDNVSGGKSLAKLLNKVGNMSWDVKLGRPNEYLCNYGLGDKAVDVGKKKSSALAIWKKECDVSEAHLATALNQAIARRKKKGGKLDSTQEQIFQDLMKLHQSAPASFKASDITRAHCDKIRTWMKKDFELAEQNRDKWVATSR